MLLPPKWPHNWVCSLSLYLERRRCGNILVKNTHSNHRKWSEEDTEQGHKPIIVCRLRREWCKCFIQEKREAKCNVFVQEVAYLPTKQQICQCNHQNNNKKKSSIKCASTNDRNWKNWLQKHEVTLKLIWMELPLLRSSDNTSVHVQVAAAPNTEIEQLQHHLT